VLRAILYPWRLVARVGVAFVRDRRATMHVLLAAGIMPLVAAVGLAVDSSRGFLAKSRLSHALDIAVLAGARVYTSDDRDSDIQKFFTTNFPDGFMDATVEPLSIVPDDVNRTLTISARATIPTTFMQVIGINTMSVSALSQATLESRSVEVAMVLDVTGSMAGQPLNDLKSAANQLVDIVVLPSQTPFYSKVALVPFSGAVNVGTYASQIRGTYTSGVTCTSPGCQWYQFRRYSDNNWQTQQITTCVTERGGTEAYTDAAPTVALLNPNYPGSDVPCLSSQIYPLTSNRTNLHNKINNLSAGGSTAGHIGIAWGWYMVSPNWAYLWPAAGQPAAYGTPDLLKVVIIMTDGNFNTIYYNGVISGPDSTSGSGSNSQKINHDSTNHPNDPFEQAKALCDAMKDKNVLVYTVGLGDQLGGAADVLNYCATDSSHVYFPSNGTELKQAFHDIAMGIAWLRLSR
jgi:Flp pilus assembly protein TadG